MQVIVVGRGQSGTRAISAALQGAGFHTGNVNPYGDMIPANAMYKAVREVGKLVNQIGEYAWDFSGVVNSTPTVDYVNWVYDYLKDLQGEHIAWKLPESVLGLPWLVQLFPDAHYIHWVRDGRDNCLKYHGSEHFRKFAIPADHNLKNRIYDGAVSWKYHEDITESTPKPAHWMSIRLEDYISNRAGVERRLSEYLQRPISMPEPYTDVVGRWRNCPEKIGPVMPILNRQLRRHGYIS